MRPFLQEGGNVFTYFHLPKKWADTAKRYDALLKKYFAVIATKISYHNRGQMKIPHANNGGFHYFFLLTFYLV